MPHIVVVGAGLAGLVAAESLIDEGVDVAVLEARDRVGGRVWSRRTPFAHGQHAEGGAEFVNADHREVLALAERFGIAVEPAQPSPTAPAATTIDAGGRVAPWSAWDDATAGGFTSDLARWRDAVARLATEIDPDDPTAAANASDLDQRDAAGFITSLALSPIARLVIGRELRTEYMVPPDEISLLHVAWMEAREQRCRALDTNGWEAFRVTGGSDRLATRLAETLGERVRLGAEVVRVTTRSNAVQVVAVERPGESASTTTIETADAVIVTVPIPVLARIAFDPPLPSELFALGYGVGAKVSVQVARRVWRDHERNGSIISDRAYGQLWETSVAHPGDASILTALLSSHDGAALAVLPDADRRIIAEIDRAFPGTAALAGGTCVTDWTNDRWSLGTYAAFAPGQVTTLWPLLRRPHGRVVLAGEHTDSYPGFMEGAMRSGRRAAATVRELLA